MKTILANKNRLLILILIIHFFLIIGNSQEYTWQPTSFSHTDNMTAIKAIDENTVWAISLNGFFFKTLDKGENWTKEVIPGASDIDLFSIELINKDIIYITGSDVEGGDTRIYKSIDGGESWDLQYQNLHQDAFLNSIAFWDENNGLAVGDPVDTVFLIVRTEDGGETWNQIPAANIPQPLTNEWGGFAGIGGNCLAVNGDSLAWFGGAYPNANGSPVRVFKSIDKGLNWIAYETDLANTGQYEAGIGNIEFKDSLNGFAGNINTDRIVGNLAKTSDGGKTWENVETYPHNNHNYSYVHGLEYVPGTNFQQIVISNDYGTDISYDGGETWESTELSPYIGPISYVSSILGWSARHLGKIYVYKEKVVPTIINLTEPNHESIPKINCYPNPFTANTNIFFSLQEPRHVTISVLDISGRKIRELLNSNLDAGNHKTMFKAKNLPSGIYFYKISTEDQVELGKIIKK